MSQVPTLVVAPCVEPSLCEQLFVEPLPARTLEQGLVWDAEGPPRDSMPEARVLVVGMKVFLGACVSKRQ